MAVIRMLLARFVGTNGFSLMLYLKRSGRTTRSRASRKRRNKSYSKLGPEYYRRLPCTTDLMRTIFRTKLGSAADAARSTLTLMPSASGANRTTKLGLATTNVTIGSTTMAIDMLRIVLPAALYFVLFAHWAFR